MNKKKFFIKPVALLIAVISMMFVFTSCDFTPEPPEEDTFSLVMDFAQTSVKVGEKVTYKAILKNSDDESYTLEHTQKLIYISVVKAEDYTDEKNLLTTQTFSDIASHGQIEEFYDFSPAEKGKYILKAYTVFSIEGKETTKDYSYECDEIKITVI